MKKIFLIILTACFLCGCSKKKFILMIEQPVKSDLNKKVLRIMFGSNIYSDTLNVVDIVPSYTTYELDASENNNLSLEIDTTVINLNLKYPSDKYIIASPSINNDGKVTIGVIKQKDKFILQ